MSPQQELLELMNRFLVQNGEESINPSEKTEDDSIDCRGVFVLNHQSRLLYSEEVEFSTLQKKMLK